MTVLEVLQSSTGYLQKRAIEHSRLNAEHLLAHVLGRKRLDLYLEFERQLSEEELIPLRDFVRRRMQQHWRRCILPTRIARTDTWMSAQSTTKTRMCWKF